MDCQNQLTTNMATIHDTHTTKRNVFDFFGLVGRNSNIFIQDAANLSQARELRDMIFDEIATDDRIVETPINTDQTKDTCTCGFCDSSLRLYTRHLPITNLLLVNQQFKAEYTSRVAKAATLVVRDYVLSDFPDDFTPCFRGINLTLPHLHLDLTLQCYHDAKSPDDCEVGNEIAMHRSWIDVLLPKLPNLHSITADVRLQTQSPSFACGPVIARNCADFTSMPSLHGLEVYLTHYAGSLDVWDYTARGTHAISWNPRSRELESIPLTCQGDVVVQAPPQQQQQVWPKLEKDLALRKDCFFDTLLPELSLAVVSAGG